jgi:hypothetical protein
MYKHTSKLIALVGVALFPLTGCNQAPAPTPNALTENPASAAQDARAAELAVKERELAQREEALKLREQEQDLARREAALAAQERTGSITPPKNKPASTQTAAAPTVTQKPNTAAGASRAAPTRVTIPSGTQLTVVLSSDLSSKTATSGDPFDARLYSDLMADGRVAVPAGARVTGTITNVISGSSKIGGIPTLGLRFDTARDTAKILGGAAAGAVLGHQVKKDDRGKVIGGILGGAIGAVAAKKTGTEVTLPADSTLTISLGAPIEVTVR